MKPSIDYTLYLVTDRRLMTAPTIEEAVEKGIRGGCTLVQLREKEASSREFYEYAVRVKRVTDRYGVPLIINDRADIALAIDAAGVHVGQSDLPLAAARKIVGEDKIVGVSASDFEEARLAVEGEADYLGVGAMYVTDTKAEAVTTSFDDLRRIRETFTIPIVVIGGINMATLPSFRGLGLDGLAVVSAILGAEDIEGAARDMRETFTKQQNEDTSPI